MKILVTGATGFLGSHLTQALIAAGHELIILKRSFSDTTRISSVFSTIESYDLDRSNPEEIFQSHHIDAILHCATNYGRQETAPLSLIEANLSLPLKLLELGRSSGVSCFINTDTILDKGVNWYSLSKSQFREWLKLFSSDILCVNVALEHFYGPGDDPTKFVTMIMRRLLREETSIALTEGAQKRDFIYIDDVVSGFMKIIDDCRNRVPSYCEYEIGSGENIELRVFVERIKELTGNRTTRLDFGALPYRDNEVMESRVDLHNMKKLGWKPQFSLDSGLLLSIDAERQLIYGVTQ